MASSSLSSTTSSSSISKDSHDLSLELQPAPLRLPSRKADANFDGSKSVDKEHMSAAEEDSSTVAIRKEITPPPPEPTVTNATSQRRPTAPKLGSLVSKFEILDAVNNVESSYAFKSKPSGIPRGQTTTGKGGVASEALQKIDSINKQGVTEKSADVSPRQVMSPPPAGNKSKLPVSTLSKPVVGNHSSEAVPRLHKNIEGISAAEEKGKSVEKQYSSSRDSADDDPHVAPSRGTSSRTRGRPG
ncbi:uncharacterized protein F4807DRAFT_465693 [Annulohypoxylon truncatum]|uniref:uncharacterized protein n=1 Tax=Annulohypoxylon truncatum TaxID=327061 RepID=UPI002008C38E|nr:uncharacterized protein F4807DRAFT_465693 [Annulohypoxylon truncatum]KAI1204459.1 hypothetical protein F4807DRAFT_465693 [Annulohypoxylon truncatum]